MRILSLGAGVQSSTLALMAERGEIEKIDHAVFADTQSEPEAVYRQLAWLHTAVSFPIHVVSKGSLRQEILDASAGKSGAWGRPPLFVVNPDGTDGMTRRQCTSDYKITIIQAKLRELAGIAKGSRGPKHVVATQVLGISADEAHRMRDADFRWLKNDYPLVNLRLRRSDCLQWLERNGYPRPPKSACTFCPYHSDAMWREMKESDPVAFADAVAVDHALRTEAFRVMLRGTSYLHRQRIPLADVTFKGDGQPSLFGEECAGVCGV